MFHLVHFECPAERSSLLDPYPSASPTSTQSKSLSSPLSSGSKLAAPSAAAAATTDGNNGLFDSPPPAYSSPDMNLSPSHDPFLSGKWSQDSNPIRFIMLV